MSLLSRLAEMIERDGVAVLATVVDSAGSAPRDAGARMALARDGSFAGTIGGGALEWHVMAAAHRVVKGQRRATRLDRALGPDLGQCCGGRVTVEIERLDRDDLPWIEALLARLPAERVVAGRPRADGGLARRPAEAEERAAMDPRTARMERADGTVVERFDSEPTPLLLFGAGHVGRALVMALAPLPFAVRWIDGRAGAFPRHVPGNVALEAEGDAVRHVAAAPDGALLLVMTHSHALDLEIVAAALAAGRFALVGLIGSATKKARFVSQLRQAGLDEAAIGDLVCPIGVPGIAGKEPAVIAASVAAQALLVSEAKSHLGGGNRRADVAAPSQAARRRL